MFKSGLLVLLGACSYGILTTFVKLAYKDGYEVGDVTGSQVFFGMSILWILYFLQLKFNKKSLEKYSVLPKKTPFYKLILLGTSFGLVSLTYYNSIKYLDASVAIILLMQFVWMSMLLEWLFYKKRPRKIEFLAAFFVLLGTVFASGYLQIEAQNLPIKGVLFALSAAFFYSLSIMVNGKIGVEYPPIKKSALMLLGSTILIFSLMPPYFLIEGYLFGGLFKWAVILALFGTVIPPIFFAYGFPKIGMSLGAILSSAELPVAVIASTIILDEKVNGLQWFGILIILFAIVVANFGVKWYLYFFPKNIIQSKI